MAESLCCSLETITTLLIGYTPTQKILKKGREEKEVSFRDFPHGPMIKTSPSNAGDMGLIPDRGAKIPHVLGPKYQNIKEKQYCGKFNIDFKKLEYFYPIVHCSTIDNS